MTGVRRQSVDRPRDFDGYGRKRPDPRSPGNAPIAVNFAINYEEGSEVAEAIVSSNFDVCCHGWRWEGHLRLSEEEERGRIARAVASIKRTIGRRPLGWYCRFRPSENTRRLLVEEAGFLYDSDAYNDELPYSVEVKGRNRLVVPYTMDANDWKFALPAGFATPDEFGSYLTATFNQLYGEGAELSRLMSIGFPSTDHRPACARPCARRFSRPHPQARPCVDLRASRRRAALA